MNTTATETRATRSRHPRVARTVTAARWAVGLKLRSLGDRSYRLGLIISEGTNAGINEECDVSYRCGQQDAAVDATMALFHRLDMGHALAIAQAANMSTAALLEQVEIRQEAARALSASPA